MTRDRSDMSRDHSDDLMLSELRRLAVLTPDPQRADRVRTRCRDRLANRAARQKPSADERDTKVRRLATVGVLAVGALYLASLVRIAVQLSTAF